MTNLKEKVKGKKKKRKINEEKKKKNTLNGLETPGNFNTKSSGAVLSMKQEKQK